MTFVGRFEEYINNGYAATREWIDWTHLRRNGHSDLGQIILKEIETVYQEGLLPQLFRKPDSNIIKKKEIVGWFPNGKPDQIQYIVNFSENGNGTYCFGCIEMTKLSSRDYLALGMVEKLRDRELYFIEWDSISHKGQAVEKAIPRLDALLEIDKLRKEAKGIKVIDIEEQVGKIRQNDFNNMNFLSNGKTHYLIDFANKHDRLMHIEVASLLANEIMARSKTYHLINLNPAARSRVEKFWGDASILNGIIIPFH